MPIIRNSPTGNPPCDVLFPDVEIKIEIKNIKLNNDNTPIVPMKIPGIRYPGLQ